jgi:hypothetical protein
MRPILKIAISQIALGFFRFGRHSTVPLAVGTGKKSDIAAEQSGL